MILTTETAVVDKPAECLPVPFYHCFKWYRFGEHAFTPPQNG